jgi:hypothetical protein
MFYQIFFSNKQIAKLMSDMAYEIHLFTRGEGSLKTTQDLFSKAELFLEYGVILYGIVREFLNQVPHGYLKQELVILVDRIPINFKQLKSKLKQVTIGKKATFNKVDCVIQETRDFMNLITKLVTSCFLCSTKYNINYETIQNEINTLNNQDMGLQNTPLQDSLTNTNSNNVVLNDEDLLIFNKYSTISNTPSRYSLINNINNDSSSQPKFRANSLNRVSNFS